MATRRHTPAPEVPDSYGETLGDSSAHLEVLRSAEFFECHSGVATQKCKLSLGHSVSCAPRARTNRKKGKTAHNSDQVICRLNWVFLGNPR